MVLKQISKQLCYNSGLFHIQHTFIRFVCECRTVRESYGVHKVISRRHYDALYMRFLAASVTFLDISKTCPRAWEGYVYTNCFFLRLPCEIRKKRDYFYRKSLIRRSYTGHIVNSIISDLSEYHPWFNSYFAWFLPVVARIRDHCLAYYQCVRILRSYTQFRSWYFCSTRAHWFVWYQIP